MVFSGLQGGGEVEPRYTMRAYAVVMTAAFIVLALAGFAGLAIAFAISVWLYALILKGVDSLLQRRFTARSGRRAARARVALDRFVTFQWLLASLVVIVCGVVIHNHGWQPLSGGGTLARAAIIALAVAALGVFASSLFDWYWVLPRVGGLVRLPPCEAGGKERWAFLTSMWYFHRALATAIVVIAVTGVPVYMLSTKSSGHAQAFWLVVSTGVAGIAGTFYRQLFRAGWYAFNPPVHVGDVIRAEVDVEGEERRRELYVVDVSLQGAKYKLLDDDGEFRGLPFETKGDATPIPNEELGKARRIGRAQPFCSADFCSGINWYCQLADRPGRRDA
jgi:hypothetical protein